MFCLTSTLSGLDKFDFWIRSPYVSLYKYFKHRVIKNLFFYSAESKTWSGNDDIAVWETNTVGASWDKEPFPHDASFLFDGDNAKV